MLLTVTAMVKTQFGGTPVWKGRLVQATLPWSHLAGLLVDQGTCHLIQQLHWMLVLENTTYNFCYK